jgi:hypothetical protein
VVVAAISAGTGLLLALVVLFPGKGAARPSQDALTQFYSDPGMTVLVGYTYLTCGGYFSRHGDTSDTEPRWIRVTDSACSPLPDVYSECFYSARANSTETIECPSPH